jgi:hypothetical protein
MEFKDLTEKEQRLVVDYKYDLFRDKVIILKVLMLVRKTIGLI